MLLRVAAGSNPDFFFFFFLRLCCKIQALGFCFWINPARTRLLFCSVPTGFCLCPRGFSTGPLGTDIENVFSSRSRSAYPIRALGFPGRAGSRLALTAWGRKERIFQVPTDGGAPAPWLFIDPRAPEPSWCLWKISPGTSGRSRRELCRLRQRCSSKLLENAFKFTWKCSWIRISDQKEPQPTLCSKSYQMIWCFARCLALTESFLKGTTALPFGEWQSLAPFIDLKIKKWPFFTFQLSYPTKDLLPAQQARCPFCRAED